MTKRTALEADFQNPKSALACLPTTQNLKFEREDWTSFRTVEGLQQKAGVAKHKLVRLVLKELTDNGLDTGTMVKVGELPSGGFYIEDKGGGIDGTPEDIARLFSIARPMVSTKLLRLPTRGALGNGLRVAAGAVLASEGTLTVTTHNRRLELRPERDGTTTVVSNKAIDFPIGTRIEIVFGPALQDEDDDALRWAKLAIGLASHGQTYAGKTSPWWYDTPQFLELLYASGNIPVRELVAELDGCSGAKAGEIVATAGLNRAVSQTITRPQAEKLLLAARGNAKQVNPKRLGAVGPDVWSDAAYAVAYGVTRFGSANPRAEIPYVVEAWAAPNKDGSSVLMACVNRTPIAGNLRIARGRRDIDLFGCGLAHSVAKAPEAAHFTTCLNITTPYMPITSDGKAPNLVPFLNEIQTAMAKAIRKAHRPGGDDKVSQKDIVLENLDAVIAAVSGDGEYRFNARQLFYALRPIIKRDMNGEELQVGNFTNIITDYEADNGEIPGMYREPRGSITHPHRNETITLGTLMVERYERPLWTFNKLLYIEKEGANEALREVRWGERHDCAVMSSKGFSTRAARDLIDKLAAHDEPVTVFCAHDADAYGTMIYQTLQEATRAREARKIQIVNIGLEPWEALDMDLEVETVKEKDRRKAVADYVQEHDDTDPAPDGDTWDDWLQTHRVELNAMTTPQFIEWLDGKMAEHGDGKLVPPDDVLTAELNQRIEKKTRAILTERILREAGFEQQVTTTIGAIKTPSATVLAKGIRQSFKQKLDREWRDHIEAEAAKLTRRA